MLLSSNHETAPLQKKGRKEENDELQGFSFCAMS
jgi:hypothetical protein